MIIENKGLEAKYQEAINVYNNDQIEQSIPLLQPLADLGMPEACEMLSFIYRVDAPFKDTIKESHWIERYLFLLKKYSDEGNLQATFALGQDYQYGNYIRMDNLKAVTLISKAAKGGLADAQFHLATLYKYGWAGLSKNYEQMSYWLDKAADQEHLEALYEKGLNLVNYEHSYYIGINYIKKSAQLGFWVAQEYLDNLKNNQI